MSSRLVWFCAIYTACDMMSTCYLAGEILYDFYKQHCRRAKKVSLSNNSQNICRQIYSRGDFTAYFCVAN